MSRSFILLAVTLLVFLIFAPGMALAVPSSSNYALREYSFGSGGTGNSNSSTYKLNVAVGEVEDGRIKSGSYQINGGGNFILNAYAPPAPAFTNPSNYYNRLKIILNTGNNPSDAKFAIAISTDNFVSDTRYIQTDNAIGSTFNSTIFQTYTTWGGAGGFFVIGLTPSTTYTVKVASMQGNFTQSSWGPSVSASTSAVTLTFDIDVASADISTAPPYALTLDELTPGSVTTSTQKIWTSLDTNADNGGVVYVKSQNAGLASAVTSTTINSATADLAVTSTGYGLQGSYASQTSGGPYRYLAPYDGSGSNVGMIDSTFRRVFDTTSEPIEGGRGAVLVLAKPSVTTPASTDYADTLTLIAAGMF